MRTAPARISKPDYVVKMSPALSAAAGSGAVCGGGGGIAVHSRVASSRINDATLVSFFLYLAAAKTKGNFTILG